MSDQPMVRDSVNPTDAGQLVMWFRNLETIQTIVNGFNPGSQISTLREFSACTLGQLVCQDPTRCQGNKETLTNGCITAGIVSDISDDKYSNLNQTFLQFLG